MSASEIISIINLIGLATIIPIAVGLLVDKRKKKFEARQELTEKRYKAIILLAHAYINYENEHLKFVIHRPDIMSKQGLLIEFQTEWVNMALYGSDKTIYAMKTFLTNSTQTTFNYLVIQMRKELYGIRSSLKLEDLVL